MTDNDNTMPGSLADLEPTPDRVFRSHLRMAHRMADACAGRFIHVDSIGWYFWDGMRWQEARRGEPERALWDEVLKPAWAESLGDPALQADVKSVQSSGGTQGTLSQASKLPQFARLAEDLDSDPYLLNARNGTYDLRSRTLRAHDPTDLCTRVLNADLSDAAVAPRWERFLAEVVPDAEVRGFLQRYVGVSLLGQVLEHKLLILLGDGRNGKGTFYGAVSYALGDYAISAEPELFMHKEGAHPTGQMDLMGRRWVVVSETERGRRLNASTLKRLTGGDRIRARRMHRDFFEFEPSHMAVMVSNFLPKVSGDDPAVWARIRVASFDVVIPEERQDKGLADALRHEADGIVQWAIRGWIDYCARGKQLGEPSAVLMATEEYREDNDDIAQFIAEFYVRSGEPGACELQKEVRSVYESWRIVNGAPQLSPREFSRVMVRHGFETVVGSKNRRYFAGMRRRLVGDD